MNRYQLYFILKKQQKRSNQLKRLNMSLFTSDWHVQFLRRHLSCQEFCETGKKAKFGRILLQKGREEVGRRRSGRGKLEQNDVDEGWSSRTNRTCATATEERGGGGGKEQEGEQRGEEPPALYVLCLSNWIAFHAVASNGPITVADGRPTYMAPEISLLRMGLEKLIQFPLR